MREPNVLESSGELFPLYGKDSALWLRKGEGTKFCCVHTEERLSFLNVADTSCEMMTLRYGCVILTSAPQDGAFVSVKCR